MRKLNVIVGLGIFTVALVTSVSGSHRVAYTLGVTVLGPVQGGHGGGPLYADGTANGGFAFSIPNEDAVFHWELTSWSYVIPDKSIDICFTSRIIKPALGNVEEACLLASGWPFALEIGGPNFYDLSGDGRSDILIRVTPVGR